MNTPSKPFGLLGEKLRHSYSPLIHSMLANYEYRLFEIPPDEVGTFLAGRNFCALNVTIPYKTAVIPFCGELSDIALRTGSVNTILQKDGMLYGDSTDYAGFAYLLKLSGIIIKDKKVCVLGNGGSSKTVCAVLSDLGAGQVVVISRSGENNYDNLGRHADTDVIVNTTPVGMYPLNGSAPVMLKCFPACTGVIDLIYNPAKTALLIDAEQLGIPCINGLPMLTAQAKRSSELFTGHTIDDNITDGITRKIAYKMKNIILVGMPGCGKSSLGQNIADKTGRTFLDTDRMITESEGRTPASIIEKDGEKSFRSIEASAVSNAGKQSGCVIATGGGVVTQRENFNTLRQNGVIVFINRSPEFLVSDNRPLSGEIDIRRNLYRTRLPLYREICDIEIDGDGSITEAADRLIYELKLTGFDI
ncbi:MAG: shikimate kinase [Eubacteriales bacterium]